MTLEESEDLFGVRIIQKSEKAEKFKAALGISQPVTSNRFKPFISEWNKRTGCLGGITVKRVKYIAKEYWCGKQQQYGG